MQLALSLSLVTLIAVAAPTAAKPRAPIAADRIEALLASPERHVRAVDPTTARLLETGARRSYTLAQLLDRLESSDVIVLIAVNSKMPLSLSGRLFFSVSTHGYRYLHIQTAPHGTESDMIATLGHELQHAVEVADSPDVHDEPSLRALYERIGHPSGRHAFDTAAAREAGRAVRGELG